MKHSNSDIISLHVHNNSPYQITLPLGLLGYCETNATTTPTYNQMPLDEQSRPSLLLEINDTNSIDYSMEYPYDQQLFQLF